MRKVSYDLFTKGMYVCTASDYSTALEWSQQSGNSFKACLDEVVPKADPKEKEWRAKNIAKKDAIRKEKLRKEAMERGARMAAAGLVRIN